MSYEIDQMRDSLQEREKRLAEENKRLKREKELMYAKVTSINPDDPDDVQTLKEVLKELKSGNVESQKQLAKENASLKNLAQGLQSKFKSETTQSKSKLHSKKNPKGPIKKAAYLAPSKQVEVILNQGKKPLKAQKARAR